MSPRPANPSLLPEGQAMDSTTPHTQDAIGAVGGREALFLLDRLSDFSADLTEEQASDWYGHVEPAIERLRLSLTPSSADAGVREAFDRVRGALEELIECASLRGDNELPHPADDPKLWTARMATAWDEGQAALDETDEPTLSAPPAQAETAGEDALASCSKGEIAAFEAWARDQRYDMGEHPLHYIFLDPKTNAARMGWKAALKFARQIAAHRHAAQAGAGDGVSVDVMVMNTTRGPDYFVRLKCGDRSQTPHVFRERFKAEYEVAHLQWVLGLRPDEPDLMAYDETSYPNDPAAPIGTGNGEASGS